VGMRVATKALFFLVLVTMSEATRVASVIHERGKRRTAVADVMGLLMDSSTSSLQRHLAAMHSHPSLIGLAARAGLIANKHLCVNFTMAITGLGGVSAVSASDASSCYQQCQSMDECVGYSFDGSCKVFSSFGTVNYNYNSAVCIQRGGCTGDNGNSKDCVYLPMPHTQLSTIAGLTPLVTEAVASEDICRANCNTVDGADACVGYQFTFPNSAFGGIGSCVLYTDTFKSATASSGLCLSVPYFSDLTPSYCWTNESCTFPSVVTPIALGTVPGPTVKLSIFENIPQIIDNNEQRSDEYIASFTNVTFHEYGVYSVAAWVDGAECPAIATVAVDDHDQHSYWRWNQGSQEFPYKWTDIPDSGIRFIIIRVKDSCPTILLYLAVIGFVGVMFLKTFLSLFWNWTTPGNPKYIPIVLVFLGISFVLVWDLVMAFNYWDCSQKLSTDMNQLTRL